MDQWIVWSKGSNKYIGRIVAVDTSSMLVAIDSQPPKLISINMDGRDIRIFDDYGRASKYYRGSDDTHLRIDQITRYADSQAVELRAAAAARAIAYLADNWRNAVTDDPAFSAMASDIRLVATCLNALADDVDSGEYANA